MSNSAIRFAAAAAAAVCLTLAAYVALPESLDVHTDIVGWPTFANFNIDRYFWSYFLLVVLLPLLTLGLYLVLTRVFVGRSGPWRPLPAPYEQIEAVPATIGWRRWPVAIGRMLLVGGVLGLEVAISVDQASEVVLATSVVYASGVIAFGWLAVRVAGRDRFVVMSALNTFAVPLVVIGGLWGVSRSTEVTITSSGEVHRYPWMPAWVALAAGAILLAYLALRVRRRRTTDALNTLERGILLLVAAPAGLFIFMAGLPGELGTFDSFEDGQTLAASEWVRAGLFPWRDILLTHGLLFDVASGLLGFSVFDESRWGLAAANGVLLGPLVWVGLYYLCAYLFWTNWLFLLGSQLVVITGHIAAIDHRMLLVPFALLLFAALLERPTVLRAAAFTVVVVVQVLVTPESLVLGAALLGALGAFEFSYGERGARLLSAYPRVTRCLAIGALLAVGWAAFLALFGALDDWIFGLGATIPGHRLTGGIPSHIPKTSFEVAAPIILILVVVAFVTVRIRLRRPFSYKDWVMIAMAGFSLLYYAKFLSRADRPHLDQSFGAAVPLLFYVVYRGITFAEARFARLARDRELRWFPRRHTLTVPLLVILLVGAPTPLEDAIRAAPGHFVAEAGTEPEVAGIGYERKGENDAGVLRRLDDRLDSLLDPGDTVFDFSNAPGVFHFILGEEPGTPYYHVSYAIRRSTQSDLVSRLRANPPAAVVLTSAGDGSGAQAFNSLPTWDGIANHVRHYDVSEYLFDHYVPVEDVAGFVLMVPRARGVASDRDLYFHNEACDWGYVPNFFTPRPSSSAKATTLPFRKLAPKGVSGRTEYAVTIPPDAARYGWLEVRTGDPLREGDFLLADRRVVEPYSRRAIYFKTLDRGETSVRVKVGSCSQWRGYEPGTLYLSTSGPQDIRELRLVERAPSAP